MLTLFGIIDSVAIQRIVSQKFFECIIREDHFVDENVREQIETFVNPACVAVIGATDRMGSWGNIIMQGLQHRKFPGRLYPVNHSAGTVSGIKAYPNIKAVPEEVNLAILAVPAESIPETVRECAEKGVQGITIIAAGFGEAVQGGREQELELARLARQNGMRLLGPNVSGTFNLHEGFNASASPPDFLIPSPITAICQGSYAIYDLLVGSYWRSMGIGQFIHTGNECDLEVTDFLEYYGDDPRTEVIVMYLETLRDVNRFREVAAKVARKKPLVVQKVGKTPGGSRAAKSHTGAMAGDYAFYRALFQQLNIIPSPAMERLIPLGHAFLKLPPLQGNRVAIITMGGSWGVALTDQLEVRGLHVPELSPSLQAKLRGMGMPVRASTRNPVDIGAAVSSTFPFDTVPGMVQEVVDSNEVDALILHGFGRLALARESNPRTKAMLDMEKNVMRECASIQDRSEKPILIGSAILPSQSQAVHDLSREGIIVFHQLDEIADVLSLKYLHQQYVSQ
jgi:acyl-CoA synthetase (NDP forming)